MKTDISSKDQLSYLKDSVGVKFDSRKLKDIVTLFWRTTLYNSLISNDKYLALLAQYLSASKMPFQRFKFYEYLDTKIVGDESVSKKLETIAFVMDRMHVNTLPMVDAYRILDKESISRLTEENLLTQANEELGFFHSTIHSYYSARFICVNSKPESFFDDITWSERETAPIPVTWYEVISFCLELSSNNDFAEWLADAISKYPVFIEEGLTKAIEQAYIETMLSEETKDRLFNVLLEHYNERQIWLPDSVEVLLARILNESRAKTLNTILVQNYKNETETNVLKSNALGVIDESLALRDKYFEGSYWHDLLIKFANDRSKNGVIQRRALKALGHIGKGTDIRLLGNASKHPDRLVHEAFLIFCYTVAPNLKITTQYLAEGLLLDCEIFARYGFYEVSSRTGINNLLNSLSSNKEIVRKFMDGESIFNDNGRHEDDRILDLVDKFKDTAVISSAKKLVLTAYRVEYGYYAERSYFISKMIDIITSVDEDYAFEIVDNFNDEDRIFRFSSLIARAVNKQNYLSVLKRIQEKVSDFNNDRFIYLLLNEGRQDIYADAVEKGIVPERPSQTNSDDGSYERNRKQRIYKDFVGALEPEQGKFLTNVFKLYLGDKEVINELAEEATIDRFKYLVKDVVLDGSDTSKIKVTINNRNSDGSNTNYTITSYAGYYADAVAVAVDLFGKDYVRSTYRDRLVAFLPFAYYEDRESILKLIGMLTQDEVALLSRIYRNTKSDTRYFMPDSYFQVLKRQLDHGVKNRECIKVLKSLISDERLRMHERDEALDVYEALIEPEDNLEKSFLKRIFKTQFEDVSTRKLAEHANKILVVVYKDKSAILWRFKQVAERAAPFVMESGFHTVGSLENELHDKPFGKPLTKLDQSYIPNFVRLLDKSLELLSIDKDRYMNYASYLWTLSYEYFVNLSVDRNYGPLKTLEGWYRQNAKLVEGANWFEHRLEDLRKIYSTEVNKVGSFEVALEDAEEMIRHG